MKSVHSCREETLLSKLSVPLLVPDAFSRTQTVVDIRFAISCDLMRSNEIAVEFNPPRERDNTRSHAIACDRMRSHEIANLMSTTVWVLENAPGTRSGTESLPKVFLHNNCEQISLLFFSPFSKRKKWEAGIILHSKTCFFCSQSSWRNTSGRIFSPVSPKQVPNVFLPVWFARLSHIISTISIKIML